MTRSFFPWIGPLFLMGPLLSLPLLAQNETGSINGRISDSSGAVVAGAVVNITDLDTNIARTTRSGPNGDYAFSSLRPAPYRIDVQAAGFRESVLADVELHTQDTLAENFTLIVGSLSDTINVTAETELETSSSVTTTVDRLFIENMPLNGRSFQALIGLTPGNVTAKTYYTNTGQFSINGQRTDANYFSIDGVSANVGITQGSNVYLGSAGAGAAQATSNNGGYNNLVSIDDMLEYKIQTSSFDAEYGRTPGAQLSIITRSGTNRFHGTAFEYLRNDVFDANSWYNNNEGLPKPAEKQNDFGGVFGGPILRDKLFFFVSYEGLRLRVPESATDVVPTTYARNQANSVVAPLLNAYPLPSTGQDVNGQWIGQFFATFSNPSILNATSLRLDYNPTSKLSLFVRGDDAPSHGSQYGAFNFYTRSTYSNTISNVDTTTAGATYIFTPTLVNDFRFNISHAKGASTVEPIAFGGATIPTSSYLFQSNPTYNIQTSVFALYFDDGTSDYYVGNDDTNYQRQLNYLDTLSWNHGTHNLKAGIDYRHLTPVNGYRPWDISYSFPDVQTLVQTQIPDYAAVDSTDATFLRPVFNDLSFFAQDSWQISPRLTLNYGLRWDYDPPPSESSGHPFYTATNLNDPANVALAPKGTPLWNASKHNFAPRIGAAWIARQQPGAETLLRGSFGMFYGLGDQQGAQGTLGFPYARSNYLIGASGAYPLSQAAAAPVPFTLDPPYSIVYAFDPDLKDPLVYMWNASVQQNLGTTRSVQITYVGNLGRDLLRQEMLTPTMGLGLNPNFEYLDVTTNNDHSNYNALQLEFKQRLWQRLQVLATYTWAHALDTSSSVAQPSPYHTLYSPNLDYGDSDYDIRNTFTNAITYQLPGTTGGNSLLHSLTNGWAADSLFRSNTAAPINITTGVYSYGLVWSQTAANQRPNVVPGQPFYLSVPGAPGGKIINAAAFSTPTNSFSQGDLARNALRGFDVWQEDFALRREFPIHESVNLLFRAEAFNVFNHPLFGDVGINDGRNILTSPYFGISSQTLAASLGGGGADGGYSSLYQIGAPRSLQFALKLQF